MNFGRVNAVDILCILPEKEKTITPTAATVKIATVNIRLLLFIAVFFLS